jgi:hypothetical protein
MDKIVEPFYILLAILKRFKDNQPAATDESEGMQGHGELLGEHRWSTP